MVQLVGTGGAVARKAPARPAARKPPAASRSAPRVAGRSFTPSPSSSEHAAVAKAATRAGARSTADILAWAAAQAKNPTSDWYRRCQSFVRQAIGAGAGAPTAGAAWNAAQFKHPGDLNPPAGAIVYWTGGSGGAGHSALSAGNGMVYSTDFLRRGKVDLVPLADINAKWGRGLKFQGWTEDTNGVRVGGLKVGDTSEAGAAPGGDVQGSPLPNTGLSNPAGEGDVFDVGAPSTDLSQKDLAAKFGFAAAFYNSDPSLKALIGQATKEQWTPDMFAARLKSTDWYAQHDAAQRSWTALTTSDPREANQRVNTIQDHVTQLARDTGVTIAADRARGIAHTAAVNGWDDAKIKDAVTSESSFTQSTAPQRTWKALLTTDPREANRQVNTMQDQIARMSRDLGVPLTADRARGLAHEAAVNGWDEAKIKDTLTSGPGYTQHTDAQRTWTALLATDPAEANQRVNTTQDHVTQLSTQLGVTLTADRARGIAHEAAVNGWDDAKVRQAVASEFTPQPGQAASGLAGRTAAQLTATARSYVVPISEQTIGTWTKAVLAGDSTPEDFTAYLQKQAKSLFPEMSDEIDRGMTTSEYLDPYREVAGKLLEQDPNTVDWTDPKWSQAVFSTGQDGKRAVQSLAQWQTTLRTDSRYGYDRTTQAKTAAAQFAQSLGQKFGAM